MYEWDIENYEWNVSKDVKKIPFEIAGISLLEQETGFLCQRVDNNEKPNPDILVDCSDQTMITELSKSQYFTLTEVHWSGNERNKGFIILIRGTLKPNGLTIRKTIPKFSEQDKKDRADRMKLIRQTNKRL